MRRINSETHYYTRLDDCKDCPAKRGERCVEDASNMGFPHVSRLRASGLFDEKTRPDRAIQCSRCLVPPGVACRSPFGSPMSRVHKVRRAAETTETASEPT